MSNNIIRNFLSSNGWEKVKLDELLVLASGATKPKDTGKNKDDIRKYPVFGGNGIVGYSSDYFFQDEGILIGRVGEYCGCVHLLTSKCWITDNALYVKEWRRNISKKFIYYLLDYLELSRLRNKGGQPLISQKPIYSLEVKLPPLPEQQKIAKILSAWDEAIALTEKLIAAKEKLKKGLMQQLLTGKKRFREFEGKKWSLKRIDEIGEVVSGGTPDTNNESYWNGEISWCTPTEITALEGGKYLKNTERKISQLGLKNSSANLLPINSVIVCTRATIGDCAINLIPMTTNQGFKSIIPKKINYEFLYYSMLAKKHVFQRLGNGSTFLEVPKKDFEKITLEVPESMEEQLKIAFVLSNIDKEIQLFGSKLEALKTQKKGLMQQLLTGKVRVQVKD